MQNREAIEKEWLESEASKYVVGLDTLAFSRGMSYKGEKNIQQWWLDKIASRDEELVKKIEGMKRDQYQYHENDYWKGSEDGHNETIDDIIKLIK